jgi:hypothetical protein
MTDLSLAQEIRSNTLALRALTTALLSHRPGEPVAASVIIEQIEAAPAPAEEPEPAAITYDGDVKPIALALAKKDRAKLVETLTMFGCAKATELKATEYAEFIAVCKGALA